MSEAKVAGERFCLYDSAALQEVLDRMAAQAATFLAGEPDPLLLGILRRGAPLAEMLQARLKTKHGLDVPRYGLRLKRYADDLTLLHPQTRLVEDQRNAALDLAGHTVLVVDDVRPSVDGQVHLPFGVGRPQNSDALHSVEVVSQIHRHSP
jgi:pyrimidine operon attenuation protein/uracil phosphoribosyltransferase